MNVNLQDLKVLVADDSRNLRRARKRLLWEMSVETVALAEAAADAAPLTRAGLGIR
jgi:hypothetical protein